MIRPAKSKAQQKASGVALAAQRGEEGKDKLLGASKEMARSMSDDELEEPAATSKEGLPERKKN